MNGYNAAKLAVEDDLEYLRQFNWRLLPWQKSLYSKIDRVEIKERELQTKLLKERKEERERESAIEKAKEQKRKRNITIIKIVIIAIVALVILIGLVMWLASLDSNGDNSALNCLFGLLLLLAWLKGGKK